jgi:catechol 2,3-dioxygenase-like lactoylglutathione lyase family enzyme
VFDHVTIRVSDRAASELFYDTVLSRLGIESRFTHGEYTVWGHEFSLAHGDDERPVTRRLHVGFAAPSREHVDEFWRAGTEAGYQDDGEPGPRPQYGPDYYGGFLLDPDGNSAEAGHYGSVRSDGIVDHLWIRVADLAAARDFYLRVAPFGNFILRRELPERAQFAGESGSFSVVAGEPTQNVHFAFETDANATVDAFHRELTGAGYRDNGAPYERPQYHPHYYGAFVLDPDGNNVEIVNHNRQPA